MATISTRPLPAWLRLRVPRSRVDTADSLPFANGERPLVTVRGTAGSVVATGRAVYHQRQAARMWTRLGWEQVGRIHWDERRGGLVLTGWTPEAPAQTVLAVPRNHVLVALARERLAWTVLISTRVPLAGHRHARVTARRQPGTDRLLWRVVLDDGVPDSPAVRAEVDAAVARLRTEQLG